jgi:hypothetical protein
MYPYSLILLIAMICFLIIPGIGAFWVRSRWRRFRKELTEGSLYKELRYSDIMGSESCEGEPQGRYRFFGTLEAIEGKSTIWLRNGSLTISVDMQGSKVYLLPSVEEEKQGFQNTPKMINWSRVSSLTEGTKVFISGILFSHSGRCFFQNSRKKHLLVIMYDGNDRTLLQRSIRYGRQVNEYWNQFTPGALGIGFLSLITLATILMRNSYYRFGSLLALSFGLLPLLPFIPPGVIFFGIYRHFWRRGRNLRALRDIIRLPLRFYPGNEVKEYPVILPDGKQYKMDLVNFQEKSNITKKYKRDGLFLNCELIRENISNTDTFLVFGQAHPENNGNKLVVPDDPMANLVILPDYPEKLSHRAAQKAKLYELIALFSFGIGIMFNFLLTAYLLITFIL